MISSRDVVTAAFSSWKDGTGYVASIFADDYAWFMTLNDGKVVSGAAFYDSIALNELWDSVTP